MARTSTHTMETEIEVVSADGYDAWYPIVEITFNYLPGSPAYTPRGEYGPIDPPEPAEVEYVQSRVLDAMTLAPDTIDIALQKYLDSDAFYSTACELAELDNQ